MLGLNFLAKLLVFVVLFCCFASFNFAQGEKKPEDTAKTLEDLDDVLKIGTELIQTGVAVFDKKGQFIKDLKREDFELRIDGKTVPISFFEQNTVGANVRTEGTAAKTPESTTPESKNLTVKPPGGRNVLFVVDDFHLSFDSHNRTRKLIKKFIDEEMTPDDTVAVVSPSGKIGFLQQFTNDKTVLRAAAERLIYTRDRSATDRSPPPMTEYEALLISQYDLEVTDIFAVPEFDRTDNDIEQKRERVRSRARIILSQTAIVNRGTYATLEQAVRNSAQLPGRKIVFFISDGFLLDLANTDSSYFMRRITDAAARANAVIYSFDAKGLEPGFPEGTTGVSQRLGFRVQSGERFDVRDGLSLLADETGGRFVRNTNDLQTGLNKSLNEASQFYLLAWEPVSENGKSEKFKKIEVIVKNRPELKILAQGGYLNAGFKSDADNQKASDNKRDKKTNQPVLSIPEQQLNRAVNSQIPTRQLSTSLLLNYIDVPNEGALLAAAVQVKGDDLEFAQQGDKAVANVDIVGIVYNADGKREGYFRQLLTVGGAASKLTETERPNIYYNYQTKLKPGLYQMRVAARDGASGRVGSFNRWITVPDLSSRKLTLSSLIISEQGRDSQKNASGETAVASVGELQLPISVDRHFARSSRLRYIVFVYNATQKTGQPDVTVQTKVLRGKDVVLTSAANKISAAGQDTLRLPYAAEISLNTLPPGRYDLQVSVQDRASKTDATQIISFEVE